MLPRVSSSPEKKAGVVKVISCLENGSKCWISLKLSRKSLVRRLFSLKIPFSLARFTANFTPLYYRLTHGKPRFTSYSLATITANSNISHSKAHLELGFSPRPLRESLADTVKWFLKELKLLSKNPVIGPSSCQKIHPSSLVREDRRHHRGFQWHWCCCCSQACPAGSQGHPGCPPARPSRTACR